MRSLSAETIVRSPLLAEVPGLLHGFTTRKLGSMAGQVYPREEQARNRDALAATIGLRLVKASQVHSADVVLVERGIATRLRDGATEPASGAMRLEADALITRERGVGLAVAVADCAPILLVTRDGWVAAAHAGWEGTTKRIVGAVCDAIAARGGRMVGARAVVGPAIDVCCYRIDAARAELIRERLGATANLVASNDGHVDFAIPGELATQLGDSGVSRIDVLRRCTQDEVGTFFSHRGEQGKAGRGLAFIGWSRP